MENIKEWLEKKGFDNSGLRTDENHRIDLYLSDVLEEFKTELLNIHDVSVRLSFEKIRDFAKKEYKPFISTINKREMDAFIRGVMYVQDKSNER